jgi:hypothetical protein
MYDQSLLVGEKPNGAAIFKKCSAEWLTEVSLSRVTKRHEELNRNSHNPDLETLVFDNRALAKKVKELSYAQHKAPQYPGGPIKANMAELGDDNEGRNCVDCHKNFHCPKSRSERVTRCPACYESYRKSSEGAQALSRSWAAREANRKGATAKSGANKSSRMYPATVDSYPMVSEDEAAEHARRQQQQRDATSTKANMVKINYGKAEDKNSTPALPEFTAAPTPPDLTATGGGASVFNTQKTNTWNTILNRAQFGSELYEMAAACNYDKASQITDRLLELPRADVQHLMEDAKMMGKMAAHVVLLGGDH